MKEITKQKIEHYLDITKRALDKVKIEKTMPKDANWESVALDCFDMAKRYFKDANHFLNKEDYVNAFACVNYAHGWLDAGARIGLFDVDKDSTLFTVD